MRRADRLFQITQLVRGRRLTQAAWLAERLEVSLRTIYRDVADLQAQGVPLEGEAGVGYRMGAGYDLAPLMFTREQAQALVATVRVAQSRLDAGLARQAETALAKILAVLPLDARAAAESLAIYAPDAGLDATVRAHLEALRVAAEQRRTVLLRYRDGQDRASERRVRPLGSFFWGQVWTLGAWCESRRDFRAFRIDRIEALTVTETVFPDEAGKRLADLKRKVGQP